MDSTQGSSSQKTLRPAKRPRLLVDQQQSPTPVQHEHLNDNNAPHAKGVVSSSGTIEKLYVTNFMCHSSMEINFNKRVNFVVGRNGSGKSAVIAALVLGLGGSAGTTSRGTSFKEFIKKGTCSSTIQITLNNEGTDPYKVEKYGSRIIVIRTLNSSGASAYKIKTSSGATISTKKEELVRILCAFNIQVDNPISVLNQDMARSFLRNSDPCENFKLFLRGTLLESVQNMHDALRRDKTISLEILQTKMETLKLVEKEVESIRNKWQMLEDANNIGVAIINLENEMYWAQVWQEEIIFTELEKELELQKKSTLAIKKELDTWDEKVESLQSDERTSLTEINDLEVKLTTELTQLNEIKGKYQDKEKLLHNKIKDYDNIKKNLNIQREVEDTVRKTIEKIDQRSSQDYKIEKEQRDSKKQKFKEKLGQVDAMMASNEQSVKQFRGCRAKCAEEEGTLQVELRENSYQCDKIERKLRELSGKSNDALSVFGAWVPQTVQMIEDHFKRGLFKKKPIGPIGAYMKVKDSSWAPAIESFLGMKFLLSFCCDCKSDTVQLNKILSQTLRNAPKPAVYTSTFLDRMHDVKKYAVHLEGHYNLLEVLDISNVVVVNTLIDSRQVESVLLLPTDKEAQHYMSDRRKVPPNCKLTLTRAGDQYMPDPNYRSYAGNGSTRCRYLQVTAEDAIKDLNIELEQLKRTKETVVQQLRALRDRKQTNDKELLQINQVVNNLSSSRIDLASQLEILEQEEEPENQSVTALLADLKDLTDRISVLKNKKEDCKELSNTLRQEVVILGEKLSAQQKIYDKLKNKEHAKQSELNKIQIKLRSMGTTNYHASTYTKQCQKLTVLENDLVDQKEAVDKANSEAIMICPRVDTDRLPSKIQEEVLKWRTKIAQIESHCGDVNDVAEEYREKATRFKKIKSDIKHIRAVLQMLEDMLIERVELYNESQKRAGLLVQYTFLRILLLRNYKGQIKLNYQDQTLEVVVSGGKIDTKSLSGGERSYSTVAFIAALWDAVDPPFYILDEFDVFMDKVNRKVILDLLLVRTENKRRHQFIFLTPQDTSNIFASENVTIHRMSDPRPNLL